MRLFMAAACRLWLFLVPFTASALGLGDIELGSALNQPFRAEIPLESVDASELQDLQVTLADPATFERYGLDRPDFLRDFQFNIRTDENGRSFIELTSPGPVAEPFVSMLIDVKWASGRLLREYTVLLDPPLFEEQPVQQAVTPAETAPAPAPTESAGEVDRPPLVQGETIAPTGLFQEPTEAAEPPQAAAPPPQPEPARVPEPQSAPQPAVAAVPPASSYVTQRGDTLWRIAERARANTGLSNNQMMLALYRANPEAFLGNINRLKAGAILRVPEVGDAAAVSAAEATAEVREQYAAYDEAATRQPGTEEARLELVAPGEDVTAGVDTSAPATIDSELVARAAQTEELQGRVGQLESELEESQRLLQLRDAELQSLQQRIAELEQQAAEALPEPAEEVPTEEAGEEIVEDALPAPGEIFADDAEVADEEPTAVIEPEAEDRVAEPEDATTVVTLPEPQPSLIGELLTNVWLWVGAAIALLLGLFVANRRRDTEAEDGWESLDELEGEADEDVGARSFADLPALDDSFVVEEGAEDIFSGQPEAEAGEEPDEEAEVEGEEISAFTEADAEEEEQPFEEFADEEAEEDSFAETAADDFEEESSDEDIDAAFDTISADVEDLAEPTAAFDEEDLSAEPAEEEVELPLEKTISTGAPLNLDQADPIAEAEFHMAYGLYDQAADLLTRALEDEPDNRPYRVKLIEVFFVWENKEGFLEQARTLHDSVSEDSDSDWSKVLILGKQLCPEEEIFAGGSAAAPTADSMDLELTDAGETELDFTLGGTEVKALDMDMPDSEDDSIVDVDLGEDLFGGADEQTADSMTLDLGADSEADTVESTMESPTVDLYGGDVPTVETDMGASTMETPTVELPGPDDEDSGSTLETPTVEFRGPDDDSASTMETPTIESPMGEGTVETPTLETAGPESETSEMPALDVDAYEDEGTGEDDGAAEPTSLDVDLSGLADFDASDESPTTLDNVEDVEDLGDDDATQLANPDEAETMLADLGDDDATQLATPADLDATMEAGDVDVAFEEITSNDTVEQPALEDPSGDTAEQPAITADPVESEEEVPGPDEATMTEVGTKLDLARAYIDMGDPEGARSILNEVLDEGGDSQQQEARQLLEELSD